MWEGQIREREQPVGAALAELDEIAALSGISDDVLL